jgi:2-haloalkanoic acid dehalogenase type II
VLLDLLMATMDSISTWAWAAGDRARGLEWRDEVTRQMILAGRYVPYEELVVAAAELLQLPADARHRLRAAWTAMRPWPGASALEDLRVPYAFVTNCSRELAAYAVSRSGLEPAFTLSAEEAGWYKPRAEIYRLACERIGADPALVRYVAGAPYDALGAAAVGLRAVLVVRREQARELPAEIRVVQSLDDAIALDDPRNLSETGNG